MDFRDFRAAAYTNNSGKKKDDDKKKTQTGEVIRNSDANVKPVSFQAMNLTDFGKSQTPSPSTHKKTEQKVVSNPFSSPSLDTQSSLEGKKISTPNWTRMSKASPSFAQNNLSSQNNNMQGFEKTSKSSFNNTNPKKAPSKSSSERLEDATDFLKSGGLIKVPVEETKPGGKDSTYRRVAKFLVLIGEDEASKVLPLLSEAQIEKIIPEIASIRTINKEEATVILEEFNGIANKVSQSGGVETARDILIKAYGRKRADELLKKAMPMEGRIPFAYLKGLDTERVSLLLKDENVGVQALVLSYLPAEQSAALINQMEDESKKEVIMRLAKMEPVSPEVLRRVDHAMHEKSLHQTVETSENIDGRNALAQILKKMDVSAENDILSNLTEEDPDLGQDLRSRLFTYEDIVNADDKFIQNKLREMSEVDIAYLIAGKTQDFQEKILSNISANRRAEVREQDKILSVKRRSDVDKITADFLSKLRQAYERGELIIKDRNDDEFV